MAKEAETEDERNIAEENTIFCHGRAQDISGAKALIHAAFGGHNAVVRSLLEAEVNTQDKDGIAQYLSMPLEVAIMRSSKGCVGHYRRLYGRAVNNPFYSLALSYSTKPNLVCGAYVVRSRRKCPFDPTSSRHLGFLYHRDLRLLLLLILVSRREPTRWSTAVVPRVQGDGESRRFSIDFR